MILTLHIASAVLVVATLLPLWRNPHWLVRGMDFPRLQLAAFAIFLLLARLTVLDLKQFASSALTAGTAACLLWQLWWIAPYTRAWPVEVRAADDSRLDRRLRILNANVLTPNRNTRAVPKLALPVILSMSRRSQNRRQRS